MSLSSLPIIRVERASTESTNTDARQLAISGAPAGTLVFAHEQTAGRGRQGNTWQSLRGNLFMSVVLRPDVPLADMGQLSFVVALALARTLKSILPQPDKLGLKWPNDIIIDGRKCAGILLESEGGTGGNDRVPWVVAGLGVNLLQAPEGSVSLTAAGVAKMTPAEFLDLFEPKLCETYDQWQNQGFTPIQQGWSALALNRGAAIRVRLPRETLEGVFNGIDGQGALDLTLADGSRRLISSGEVYL